MESQKRVIRKRIFNQVLSILLCIVVALTAIPINAQAASTSKKFIKVDHSVFDPSAGEITTVSFNLEGTRVVDIKVMKGTKTITYLKKGEKYEGKYKTYKVTWDGKDSNGNKVSDGTYKIVVQPTEAKYKKGTSTVGVSVVNAASKEIGITPNAQGDTFKIFGTGGTNQGTSKVTLAVSVDGKSDSSINATVDDNMWYADLPMSMYSLYNVKATISKSSGTVTRNISAVRHVFRVGDKMKYLAALYYGDYTKDTDIIADNGIAKDYTNEGALVGTNILIINPSKDIAQNISNGSAQKKQHLGVIDQLQRIASTNPVFLSMGNNFYSNSDISIDGYSPLEFERMYNSMSYDYSEFGINWSNSYSYYLQDMGSKVAIVFNDGHSEYYTKNSDGSYKAAEGLSRTLVKKSDGSYKLTMEGTSILNFAEDGSLQQIADLNGNTLKLTYKNDMLTKVENTSGYFNITYNTDGTIKSISDSGDRSVSYTYTNGLVTGFIDVNGNTTTYEYDKLNRLTKVISPEKIVLFDIEYDDSDRVIKKTIQGGTYKYSYDDKNRDIVCTEPNGNTTTFHYSKDYKLEYEKDSNGTIQYYYQDSNTTSGNTNVTKSSIKTSSEKIKATAVSGSGITVSSNILELKTHNMNVCTGTQTNNTLYPQFRIKNTSTADIDLSDVTLRYYYTVDGDRPQNFFCDWFSMGGNNEVTGKFVKVTSSQAGTDYYMEVGFTTSAGKLAPGQSVELHTRIGKDDWSVFTPGDDYSQNQSTDFSSFNQVDMFYKGNLVWGKGSQCTEDTTSNNGNSNNNNSNNNNSNNSNSGTVVDPDEVIIPSGTNKLKLKMYNTGNSGSTTNTIHPMMELINTGTNMIKLEDITIRYYYTPDDKKAQNYWCDWCSEGSQNVTGIFKEMQDQYWNADTYLEIGFKPDSGYIGISEKMYIHSRIAKNDWSNYDITNDYSINSKEGFIDWDKVDVFVKGVKVWGQGVVPSEEEEDEDYIEYADATKNLVRAEMYNTNTNEVNNCLAPRYRIYNTGTEDIKLSDLKINYFYTTDDEEKQIFEPDWAGIGSNYQSNISKSDITCDFTEVGDDNVGTNCVANIGFTRDDLVLKPGDYLELHTRIHRGSWTTYLQNNDFSFNKEDTNYAEWNKIAVFLGNTWVWGSMPVSYAELIGDNDTDNSDTDPIDGKGGYDTNTDKSGNKTYYTYDENGNVTSETDALGYKTTYTYNEFNQVTSMTDALGNTVTYDYDSKGNLISYTDALGNKTTYTYNSKGCLTKTTNPDGTVEKRTYDSKGNLLTVTDENGNVTTYEYDKLNRVTKITEPEGNIETYEYTLDSMIKKVTDALGNSSLTQYNADGQVTKDTNKNGKSTLYQYSTTTGQLEQMTDAKSNITKYQYDNMGNLTVETAADGSKTTYEYDKFGRQSAVIDALGARTEYTYDVNGNLTVEKDALGNETKYNYDKLNRVTSITDALNQTTKYEYDAIGREIKEIDANGGSTFTDYDPNGNVVAVTDKLGNVTKNVYDTVGNLKSTTDAKGNKTLYEYDGVGNQTKVTDALGNVTLSSYDKNGNITSETDALGNITSYTYNGINQVLSEKDALGNTTSYKYDAEDNLLQQTDAKGSKVSYTYDALGNPTKITDALGGVIKYSYNKVGQITKETDALGNVTTYTYDTMGRTTSVKDPLGNTSKNEYNATGLLVSRTDENGNKTIYTYDANGQTIKETDTSGNTSEWTYDSNGNILTEIDASGAVKSYTYDKADQITEEMDALGHATKYKYDANGNQTEVKDPKGNKTTCVYDKNNNLTKVTNALGEVTKYSYDKLGNRTKQTRVSKDGTQNQVTGYKYDSNSQLTTMTDAAGATKKYTYDTVGNLTKLMDKDGSVTKYEYDKSGNLLKTTYSDNRSVAYTYNSQNQVTSMTDWNGTTAYTYDTNGNKTKATDSKNQVTQYTYSKTGQKQSITYPDGTKVQYVYDKLDNLTKVMDGKNHTTTYTYDSSGHIKTKELPNGSVTTYSYNNKDQLTKREEVSGSGKKVTYAYTYDSNGNLVQKDKTESGTTNTTTYAYDTVNQLIKVADQDSTRAYTYDEFNNRLSKSETGKSTINYTYNNLNQLTKSEQGTSEKTYTYDKKGNLGEVQKDGVTQAVYTFDATNHLAKAVKGNVTSVYSYDGQGNRIQLKDSKNGSVMKNQTYVVDTESDYNDIIMSTDELTGKDSVYTYGIDKISVATDGKTSYYVLDEQGSITKIQDESGNENTQLTYDEFGNLKNPDDVDTNGNIFAYTGHVYDDSTGLYYAKARYYDSQVGRFISEDSYQGDESDSLSLNLYTYVKNNPIKYTDPSGNRIRLKQIDNFLYGVVAGGGSWIKDLIKTPSAIYHLGKSIVSGDFSITKLAKAGFHALVDDYVYLCKHWYIFYKPLKTYSDKAFYKYGYHLGRFTLDVVTAIAGGKLATAFAKTKIGKKLVSKLEKVKGNASRTVKKVVKKVKGARNALKYGDDFGKIGIYVKHPGTKINWAKISKHGLERINQRGVTKSMAEKWVKNGKAFYQNNGSKHLFFSKDGAAVVANDGTLVTAIPKSYYDDVYKNLSKTLFGN